MLRRTEGIVLKTLPFGEADLIVTLLTPAYGIIRVFAKSPRKIGSRFGSSLEPLTCVRLSFWGKEDAALPRLTQSDIVYSFQVIRDNFQVFLRISGMIELTVALILEKDVNARTYSLFLNTLCAVRKAMCGMNENNASGRNVDPGRQKKGEKILYAVDVLISHYIVNFLKYAGFAPKLDACGRCGKEQGFFYVSSGAILCKSCAKSTDAPVEISAAMRRLYQDLLLWDTEKVHRIKPSQSLLAALANVIRMHVEYVVSKPLKVENFIRASSGIFH